MPAKCISIVMILLLGGGWLAGEVETQLSKGLPVVEFIPGLPQLISGKVLKGSLILGACLTTIVGVIWNNQKGNDYYDQYLLSTDVEEVIELRAKAEKSYRNRNYFIIGMVSVWVLHLLDLKFFKNKKGGVKGEVKNNSLYFGFYYSF